MKTYLVRKKESSIGATGQGGLKVFVDYLKYKLHLPFILKDFGDKLWGYKLASLVLLLLCRSQIGAKNIAQLREKLLCRFVSRLFYIQYEAKTTHQETRQPVAFRLPAPGYVDPDAARRWAPLDFSPNAPESESWDYLATRYGYILPEHLANGDSSRGLGSRFELPLREEINPE